MHWSYRKKLADQANPWAEMEMRGTTPRTALWEHAQVLAVAKAAREHGKPSIGLAKLLGCWLGHRQADVLALTWEAVQDANVATRKTVVVLPVDVSAYSDLAEAVADAPRSRGTGCGL